MPTASAVRSHSSRRSGAWRTRTKAPRNDWLAAFSRRPARLGSRKAPPQKARASWHEHEPERHGDRERGERDERRAKAAREQEVDDEDRGGQLQARRQANRRALPRAPAIAAKVIQH